MINAKKELLELAGGEEILAISLGAVGWTYADIRPTFFRGAKRVKEALEILNFDFDSGYGGENGYSLYAWTKSKIMVKGTYDGSEWYEAVPRKPTSKQTPNSIGG